MRRVEREDAIGFVDVVFTRRVKFTKEFDSVVSGIGVYSIEVFWGRTMSIVNFTDPQKLVSPVVFPVITLLR